MIPRIFLGLIIFTCIITGCKKKDGQPFLSVKPAASEVVLKEGEIFTLEITGKSQSRDPLIKLVIETISPTGQNSVTYDTTFSSDNLTMSYDYVAPEVSSESNFTIKITLTDGNGLVTLGAIRLRVADIPTATNQVKEYTGIELYSSLSTKKDGYSISSLQALYHNTQASQCDLYDHSVNDSLNTYALGKTWKSETGLQFVRFNQFDYANASFESMKNSFDAGVKSSFIDNITAGDIVLTRLSHSNSDSGYVAIKLIYVIDENDTTNANSDKYIFTIKK